MKAANKRKSALLIAGGLFVAAVGVVLINQLTTSNVAVADDTTGGGGNVPSVCAKTIHYAAYDAPGGSNDFGPDQHFGSVEDAQARFNAKACEDPLFAAVQAEAKKDGQNIDASAVMARAQQYVNNRQLWANDVKAFNSNVASMTLTSYNTSYETLGMVPGNNSGKMPRLVKASEEVNLGQSLDVKLKDGTVLHERTICDLQLSVPRFPHVPTPTPTPTPPTHTTTPPAPTCTPTPGVESCGKHASYAPKPTGGNVVTPPPGGYIDRSGHPHTSSYVPPPNTNPTPGKTDSGRGATNTAPASSVPHPSATATVPKTDSPTTNPVAPPAGG